MANYPTSLDTLSNPNSSDPLSSPSHSSQHGTGNDILEALEAKVGTGSSTPTTTGHVLTVTGAGASAWSANVDGVVAEGRLVRGTTLYTIPGVSVISFTTSALTGGVLYYCPVVVASTITADRITCDVATAGVAGATIRLGIFEATIDWVPSTLTLDAGTVAADTTGQKDISISQTLTAKRYFLAVLPSVDLTLTAPRGQPTSFIAANAQSQVISINKSAATSPFPDPGQAANSVSTGSVSGGYNQLAWLRLSAA